MVKLKVKRVRPCNIPLPYYATKGSVGLDLSACIEDPIVLKPSKRVVVPTGIAIELPEGYEAQVRPRSGLALKYGITILNSPGTIDTDYRGEIQVILINLSEYDYTIHPSDRIAQLVVVPVVKVNVVEVIDLENTERGVSGFGSTGR